jgi:hypothetical protein
MSVSQHIWNHFVFSGRLEEARREAELPNSGLKAHLLVIRKEYPQKYSEVLDNLSEILVANSLLKPESDLYTRIGHLVAAEKFCDALLLDKINPKKVSCLIKSFAAKNHIYTYKKGDDTIWTIPTKNYDVEIEFEKFGKYKGLRYSLKVFPKDEKRMYSTCLFSFCCECLMGFGIGRWDLVFDEEQLTNALENLWKNCNCICDALDSYSESMGSGLAD